MWKVTINRDHVVLWRRWLVMWCVFVAFLLVIGWHLKPRIDEFLFVLFLPVSVLIPYIAVCFFGAYARILWAEWNQSRLRIFSRLRLNRRD